MSVTFSPETASVFANLLPVLFLTMVVAYRPSTRGHLWAGSRSDTRKRRMQKRGLSFGIALNTAAFLSAEWVLLAIIEADEPRTGLSAVLQWTLCMLVTCSFTVLIVTPIIREIVDVNTD